ncbi:MAG: CDP-diacylglycerol--serine O-phosphatidyltransferase [Cyclobacteriaceae bacterium]|nr:CDP-diacylglycerol--serine O-phosphatidyltransferase [Cyclobacteriaceae bacterium]MDX5466387.1 CDP-diacylglycerol--serine O-phosphatidyltransferase [Cyclobacteriaceae bacterium]
MNLKVHIPNILTLSNLLLGVIGIISVLNGNIFHGATFVLLAAGFDFLDGFAARLLKVQSNLGKELDSLADVVSFGVLPGVILFQMTKNQSLIEWLPYLTLIVPMFSAYRLAKFNLDTRQSERFIGLPTPANALFISTLPHLFVHFPKMGTWLSTPIGLIAIAWVFSVLLISEIPLIALKFKNFTISDNIFRFLLLGIGIFCFGLLQLAGIPILILAYIGLSLIENAISRE